MLSLLCANGKAVEKSFHSFFEILLFVGCGQTNFVLIFSQDNTIFKTMKENKRVAHRTPFEYGDDRVKDLMRVFYNQLGDADTVSEMVKKAVASPSERFWVSEERALRIVSAMERGRHVSMGSNLKREMFAEIYRRCCRLAVTHPDWPLLRRVSYVVNHEAPRFYMSESNAHSLICRERRRARQLQRRKSE